MASAVRASRTRGWQPNLAVDRHRRLIAAAYAGVAVLLLPWIVVIFMTQPVTAVGHHLPLVVSGSAGFVTACVVLTGVLIRIGSMFVAMAASATASAGFVVTWFHALARSGWPPLSVYVVEAALVPVVVVCGWMAVRGSERPEWRPSARLGAVFGIAAVLFAAGTVRLAVVTPSVREADHLRLVWTGLDLFEFVVLAVTAWACYRRSRLVEVSATATATLLVADAWFNITPTIGVDRLAGIAMALVELPLAAFSIWLAWPSPARVDCRVDAQKTDNDLDPIRPTAVVRRAV